MQLTSFYKLLRAFPKETPHASSKLEYIEKFVKPISFKHLHRGVIHSPYAETNAWLIL